jgi:hypothetical protein
LPQAIAQNRCRILPNIERVTRRDSRCESESYLATLLAVKVYHKGGLEHSAPAQPDSKLMDEYEQ